jgi:translation initiation factor 5
MTTLSMHTSSAAAMPIGGKATSSLTSSSGSSSTVNVIRGLDDPFYRYRMEPLRTKIEGNGNGIKTVLTNMDNIGKSLNRPPSYPTKYFGCELGAQTRFDDKTARYIVNGAHEAGKLSELLDEFIKKFVLCPSCNNPETDLLIDKNNDIVRVCKACGQRNLVDMRHKLTTFIMNNPPPGVKKDSTRKQKESKKRDKKDKTLGKKKSSETSMATVAASHHHHHSHPHSTGGSDEDPDIEAPPELGSQQHHRGGDFDEEADWGDEVNEEVVQHRNREMDLVNEKLDRLNMSGSDEDAEDPTKQLFDALVNNRDSPDAMSRDIDTSGVVRADKIALVLASAVFDDDQLSPHWVTKYAPLLKRYATDAKSQRNILIGMERAFVNRTSLATKIPLLFKSLYDNDVVDEEVFIKWSRKNCPRRYVPRDISKLVHEKAHVFIRWLETAEEESSSSAASENDDDEEEVTTTIPAANKMMMTAPTINGVPVSLSSSMKR